MTGDKPDPRIRTPMHWRLDRAAGFSEGVPWEPLQADSLTANVEAQEGDEGSILNLYRELIHLRTENPILGSSPELVPLSASTPQVVAYLRRSGEETALVLGNLEVLPLAGVTLSSAVDVLPQGRYRLEALLGEETAARMEIGDTGQILDFSPVSTLEPLQAYVFVVTAQD